MNLKELTYTHEAVADLILKEPTVTIAELAAIFGMRHYAIRKLVVHEVFKKHMAYRKATLIDPHISRSLNERARTISMQAMEIISKRMVDKPDSAYALKVLTLFSAEAKRAAGNDK